MLARRASFFLILGASAILGSGCGAPDASAPPPVRIVMPQQTAPPPYAPGDPAYAAPLTPMGVAPYPAPLGAPLPSFNGFGPISIGAFRGHVAVIHFWATWCEPCKKTLPLLSALATRYQANGLAMVAVSDDDDAQGILPFLRSYPVAFPVVLDTDKAWARQWTVPNMPSTYVIDRAGTVRFVHLGYHQGDESAIETELRSLL